MEIIESMKDKNKDELKLKLICDRYGIEFNDLDEDLDSKDVYVMVWHDF